MANDYGLPPNNALSAWLGVRDSNNRQSALNTQNMAGQIGILGALQQQALRRKAMEDEALLKQAIATGDIGKVAQLSPATAKQLMDINEARRQQDWFSPANTQRFMVPGAPGKPAETMATGGSFNPEENAPAVAPGPARLDLPRFAQAGVMQGIKGAEPLLNHLSQREQARATLAQNYQLAQERLQRDYDLAAQRGADQRELAQMRIDGQREMRQLAAALRQQQQTPLEAVIGPDGKPVLVPRDQAVGRTPARRDTNAPRALPTSALKMQQEALDGIGTARSIGSDIASIEKQIDDGNLNLSLVRNVAGEIRNQIGISNEQSRNLASFKATLEKMRNDSLRLNKGVQTEGDSVRAWNELVRNINDKNVVKQRLQEIQLINQRAAELRTNDINVIRENFGQPPLDISGYQSQPATVGANRGQIQRPAGPTQPAAPSITDQADAILRGGR